MSKENKTILLAEDDEAISSMYKMKLEQNGYKVFIAKNGAEALDLALKEIPDLVLLDVIMPMLDGFSVLERLKMGDKTKNIKVILLTNLSTDEDKKKGEEMGASDYLVKADLTPSELLNKIDNFLKK